MSPRWDQSPEERYWSKVEKTEGCWNWTAGKSGHGYGRFKLNGQMVPAHRVSYEEANGSIPRGMHVDHICHNPACVRPSHLRAATNKENQENRRGAQADSKSGVRGVYWNKQAGKWLAQVTHHGRKVTLGYFERIEDADAAVTAKRLELFTHNDLDRIAS